MKQIDSKIQDRCCAGALVAACVAIVVTIAHHPVASGATMQEKVASITQQSAMDQYVHGGAMGILLLLFVAMTYWSERQGRSNLSSLAAPIVYGLAVTLGFIAMAFDGFVMPRLATTCIGNSVPCLTATYDLMTFASVNVQVFTRLSLFLMVGAIMLWSLPLIRVSGPARATGAIGIVAAAVQLWLLSGIAVVLTPHTLIFVLVAQVIWYLAAAWFLVGIDNSLAGNP